MGGEGLVADAGKNDGTALGNWEMGGIQKNERVNGVNGESQG